MKIQFFKQILLLGALVGIFTNADAQRRGRKRGQPTTTPTQQVDTTKLPTVNNNNTQQPTNYNPYGNLPIIKGPVVGGFNDTTRKSLRDDNPYGSSTLNVRTPLPYEYIRPDDVLFKERVWREIDLREKMNQIFRYKTADDNGDQRLVNILVKAIRDKQVTAFSGDDDRFTTPLDSAEFESAITGGSQCDTNAVYRLDDPTKIDHYVVNCNTLDPDEIVKIRIKEDWIFDRATSRLVCRIIGIAPCKTQLSIDKKTERGVTPLFWIYYPDLRPVLAKYEVYNPKKYGPKQDDLGRII